MALVLIVLHNNVTLLIRSYHSHVLAFPITKLLSPLHPQISGMLFTKLSLHYTDFSVQCVNHVLSNL